MKAPRRCLMKHSGGAGLRLDGTLAGNLAKAFVGGKQNPTPSRSYRRAGRQRGE
jgi:hypothetical protein